MYQGKQDGIPPHELCSNTAAELDRDLRESGLGRYDLIDDDRYVDELIEEDAMRIYREDREAIATILKLHVENPKTLLELLVEYAGKARKGLI